MKKILRLKLSLLLFFIRSKMFQDFIMWPLGKRILGLSYSEIIPLGTGLQMRVFMSYPDMHNRILLFYSTFVSFPWEQKTMNLFRKLLLVSDSTIIAGANIGYYAIVSGEKLGPKTHAFEPVPKIYNDCLENLKLNDIKISLNREALSSKEGTAEIFFNAGDSSLLPSKNRENSGMKVTTITLDQYCTKNELKPDLILLDVEGLELEIFRGAQNTLRTAAQNIIFEINFKELKRASIKISDIITLLKSYNYEIFIIEDDYEHENPFKAAHTPLQLLPFSNLSFFEKKYEFINCVATKNIHVIKDFIVSS